MKFKLPMILLLLTLSCDDATDSSKYFQIQMYGVAISPSSAIGNSDPINQTYNLKDITMILDDDTEVDLYDVDAKEVVIVNRQQIIFSKDVTEHDGKTIKRVLVTMAPTVTVRGKYKSDMTFTLENPVLEATTGFTINVTKAILLSIIVKWQNTVTKDEATEDETVSVPDIELQYEST